jgi:hypothetical protein
MIKLENIQAPRSHFNIPSDLITNAKRQHCINTDEVIDHDIAAIAMPVADTQFLQPGASLWTDQIIELANLSRTASGKKKSHSIHLSHIIILLPPASSQSDTGWGRAFFMCKGKNSLTRAGRFRKAKGPEK